MCELSVLAERSVLGDSSEVSSFDSVSLHDNETDLSSFK